METLSFVCVRDSENNKVALKQPEEEEFPRGGGDTHSSTVWTQGQGCGLPAERHPAPAALALSKAVEDLISRGGPEPSNTSRKLQNRMKSITK